MRITLPPPRALIAGIAALAIKNAPVRLIRMTRSQAASSSSSTVPEGSASAAPYMRTSRPPKRSTVAATAARQLAPLVTSRWTGSAWAPVFSISAAVALAPGSSTSAQATRAPAAANASAVARPIPLAAPTTIAVFFSSANAESIIVPPSNEDHRAAPSISNDRDHFDFDEQVRVREPADFHRGARRQRAEVLHPDVGVLEELLDVRDVRVGLHAIGERGASRGQRRLDVLADLTDLRAHVASPDRLALAIPRELAGHEDRLLAFDDHDMGIEHVPINHPLAERFRLDVLALHGLSPWSRSRRTITGLELHVRYGSRARRTIRVSRLDVR